VHKSQEELQSRLTAAAKKVVVNGFYAHYKNPEQTYKVLHLAITEWDDEICVIYRAQYEAEVIFVRPLKNWLETVEWQGEVIDRFTRVKE
jgi:hypothetical protein